MPAAGIAEAFEDTDALLHRVGEGDQSAASALLDRHRERLRQMVDVRIDDRLAARVDPSDVVQETLLEAAGMLAGYARDRPLPFYPWLRQLAIQQLSRQRRTHLETAKRAVEREVSYGELSDRSAWLLAERLVTTETGPIGQALRDERRRVVRSALATLPPQDREVLVLRYLEQLSSGETAAVLGVSDGAVKMRHLRALQRMRLMLKRYDESFDR